MGDIDELLDEVERKFCTSSKYPKSSCDISTVIAEKEQLNFKKDETVNKTQVAKGKKNLDDLIDDFLNDTDYITTSPKVNSKSKSKSRKSPLLIDQLNKRETEKGNRCFPLLLAGSSIARGYSTNTTKKACDKLRCTDCDFNVISFDNFVWKDKVDYLFLRNNVPDFERLLPMLIEKNGLRAYACQCKWKNASDLIDLNNLSELKWVCGKH